MACRSPSLRRTSIDPCEGRRVAMGKMMARRTRTPLEHRGASRRPCRARAEAHSAARTPPSCTGNSKPRAMPEVPRRPGLREVAGSATAPAWSSRPVGRPWTGGERREERAEDSQESQRREQAVAALVSTAVGNQRLSRCRAHTPWRQSMHGDPLICLHLASSVALDSQRPGVS